MEHLVFDAMHGSTVKGASNAEPHLRTDSGIATMEKLRFAGKSSFSASKNKCSTSPAINNELPLFISAYLVKDFVYND